MGAVLAVLPKKLSGEYHEFQIMSGYLVVMFVANGIIAYFLEEGLPDIANQTAWLSAGAYAAALLIANFLVIEGFKYLEANMNLFLACTITKMIH